MSFSVYESYVALCNNERVIMHNIDNNTEKTIILPDLEKKKTEHNKKDIEDCHMITSLAFSEDGKYFAVCTNGRQLCLYETKDFKLLSNRTLSRAASRMRFSPNNDIVIADRAGDAYLFSTSCPTEAGTLILGHLSMLLDVLVTQDMKYVLTADREEKIRVSMFPNCYNIVSYCLGHKKFVTNISELPHEKSVLISCGGDGVFKLWDYKYGSELLSVNFYDKISKCDIERFNQDLDHDEYVDILPVKYLRVYYFSKIESLIIISFYSSKILLVYKISGDNNTQLKANYLESITVETEPIECLLYKQDLWVLTDVGLRVFKFDNDRFVTYDALNSTIKRLNASWQILNNTIVEQNSISVLYKKTYDNVKEYQKKKKMRLAGNTK
ncbi:tRNA (guanine-N(7)-)-methyltransferase subunit WDR4 [Trachymyrmex septentrionalis]|uniref:tRNA (Guanine-N(7)-)-methyltransferase subunit WDR4 n=1 Tax=Trachymyrmex septentrionalis TaxID=34720 RepID=A0A195ET14_9HYME|nr:PREDICTED: tRNA (guanine-N(7)-)-methyltransferase non-catalytic subunit WDR4 [Trachymyrmex septentrionalis]KYN31024.1 tRNA (guanine-N(7)-)-methyltransferase subunit WDR4 [Trachymyrmex septentrionalis]